MKVFSDGSAMGREWRMTGLLSGECAGSPSVCKPRKGWIDAVKDCLKKRRLDVRQARRTVHNRSVWRGFVRENA